MGFEDFEPIFGEPKVEWASAQAQDSDPLPPFLFRVHASDPSHLTIHVTDFHSNTWEAVKSVVQLEDMVSLLLHLALHFVCVCLIVYSTNLEESPSTLM